jgi:ComF family protein
MPFSLGALTQFLLRGLDEVLSVIFQTICLSCDRLADAEGLCSTCIPIRPIRGPLCPHCGETLPEVCLCGACEAGRLSHFKSARSLLWLCPEAKTIIHKIKYGRRFELLSLFRNSIEEGFSPFYAGSPLVVPVPLYSSKYLTRGFNTAEILAVWLAARTSLPVSRQILRKGRETEAQSSLDKKARARNLRGVFDVTEPPPPSVLIVDDIFTTGATLEACAHALRRKGAREIYGWTLFRTPAPGATLVI